MTADVTFRVAMHCGGCENAVRTVLSLIDGVLNVEADYRRSEVRVRFDPERVSPDRLRTRLSEVGFEPHDR